MTRNYDALSRLENIITPDNTLTFTYDAGGNRLTATDDDSDLSFTYDALNRLETATTVTGGSGIQPAVTLTSVYDAVGNRRQLTEDGGAVTAYDYDGRGIMTRLTTPDLQNIDFTFRPDGGLERIVFPNGVTSDLTYDLVDRRIETLTHGTSGGSLIDFTYDYDAGGNVSSIVEAGQTRSFGYDALAQLTAGGFASAPESYTYDEEGNRVTSHLSGTHVIDDANRLLEDDQFCYAYDANGNLENKTAKVAGACTGGVTTYTWNAQDQLVRIDFPDLTFAAYRYDALGRRVEKDVNGTITRYVYDDENILLEYDGAGTLLARYSHGNDLVDQPLAMSRGGQNYYYQSDYLGSVRKITDATGAVVNSYDYDSFGNFEAITEAVINPYGFTAREHDPESPLHYYRARYYDPNTGRFLSEDPLEDEVNLYRYAKNNPIMLTDPFGLTSITAGDVLLISGIVVAAAVGKEILGNALACFYMLAASAFSPGIIPTGLCSVNITGPGGSIIAPPDKKSLEKDAANDNLSCVEWYDLLLNLKITAVGYLRLGSLEHYRYAAAAFNKTLVPYRIRCLPKGFPDIAELPSA